MDYLSFITKEFDKDVEKNKEKERIEKELNKLGASN